MNISVFGLGYVGLVTAACLARRGHHVVGVDAIAEKVESVNAGKSPIVEAGVGDLIAESVAAGRLRATADPGDAVRSSEIAFLCVGTPGRSDGTPETKYLEKVSGEIGSALRDHAGGFLVVVRSTVLPGTVRNLVIPKLEACSSGRSGENFDVVFHPEFLREGSSVWDFDQPPMIVVGEYREGAASRLMSLYDNIEAPRFFVALEEAELIKYANNAFHAAKITFANEIGQLCYGAGVDSRKVMDILCSDSKFNISPVYLRPGFAFGGSCLPKDLRAILAFAGNGSSDLPMLGSILESNRMQIDRAVARIFSRGRRRIGIYGLAFKPGTDDLRESPMVQLAETLIGKGCEIRIFDASVKVNRLMGKNKAYIDCHFPHLAELLCESMDEFADRDTVVLGHALPAEETAALIDAGTTVLDLTGRNQFPDREGYESIV